MVKISETDISLLISKWMGILGLSQWSIKWEYTNDEEQETLASIWCVPNTRTAVLRIQETWDEGFDLEDIVVHEMVHVLISPISRSIDVIFDNHDVTNDTIDLYNNIEEQVIDKIAKSFLSMRS